MTISNHAMRIRSQVIGQKRVSGSSLEFDTWLNAIPRPVAWIVTVIATRHEAIKSFVIIAVLIVFLLVAAFLKVFDNVRDRSKAVHLANMLLYSLRAEAAAHGEGGLDNLQVRASCLDVLSDVHDDAARLNVHMR